MSTGSGIVNEKDFHIIEGPLWNVIWVLTWPIMINMCAFGIGTFVDTWVAGRLSADAQAAMAIGWQIRYFMMMFTMALEVGATALISRYFGARDRDNTIEAARQSLIWGGIFAIASVCISLPTCTGLLHLLGASPGVEQEGWEYLKFALIASIPSTLLWTTQSIFRAIGNTRTAMSTTIVGTTLVILFDFLFCFYPWHMGIGGIGISWILAGSIVFIWNVFQLAKSDMAPCLSITKSWNWSVSKDWFFRIMTIGVPGCIQEIAMIMGSFGLFSILAYTSQPAINQAAWGIGWRLEEVVIFMPMFALSTAISIIVGQNLGANQVERAAQATWKMVWVGVALNAFIAALLYLLAPNIASLMSDNTAVAKATVDYLYLIAWTEPFTIWFILSGAMQGAAYTRVPMYITIICYCVFRLSLAWYLTINAGLGANGTWIAMALSSVLAAVLTVMSFQQGKWKNQIV
jgi:putative MATE family efflux protein